jgi:hypothetical protein
MQHLRAMDRLRRSSRMCIANGKLAALVRATGLVSAANILARRKLGFARPIVVRPRREKKQV